MTRVHVCLDLDGTALDLFGRAPVAAFDRLRAEVGATGGRVTVATARCVQDVARLLRDVAGPVDAWCSDGACRGTVCAGRVDAVVDEHVIDAAAAARATEHLVACAPDGSVLLCSTSTQGFALFAHPGGGPTPDLLQRFGDERPYRSVADRDDFRVLAGAIAVRAVALLDRTDRTSAIARTLQVPDDAQVLHYAEDRAPGHSWIDVIGSDVSKAGAVRALRSEEIDSCVVVAVGNGRNDLPLLDAADVGICPRAADPELLACADHVIDGACGEELLEGVRLHVLRLQQRAPSGVGRG